MKIPIDIRFHNVDPSEALFKRIHEKIELLERFYPGITGCHVIIERRNRRHHKGDVFHVTVDVTVPHGDIVASRDPGIDHAHEDPYVALRDAFNAARRRLQDFHRKQGHTRENEREMAKRELFEGGGA